MVEPKDKVEVTKVGNLRQGQEGTVTNVDSTPSYPVTVKFPDGRTASYHPSELRKK